MPGYRAYEVSSEGRVRSLDRLVAAKLMLTGKRSSRLIKGRTLTPVIRPDGTPCANLWRQGDYVQVPIRRLMMLAFVGPRPRGMDAAPINGDMTSTDLSNLHWTYTSHRPGTLRRLLGMG